MNTRGKIVIDVTDSGYIIYNESTKHRIDVVPKNDLAIMNAINIVGDYLQEIDELYEEPKDE